MPGRPLKRHTPTLWNLAWSSPVFWDGRARSLEEQVAGPIESPDEMAQPLVSVVTRLAADAAMARAFAAAFPETRQVNALNLARALATYERTFVSPPTRFDRWIAGDAQALTARRGRGFPFVHRQGRLRQMPQWICLHRLCVPRHRAAERGSRARRGAASAGGGARLQDTGAARDRPLRSLHARRLARDAGGRDPALRARHGRAPDPVEGSHAQAQADASRARRPDRLPGDADERARSGIAGDHRGGEERADDAGGTREHGVARRQKFSSRPHRASARRAIVDRQQ